MNRIAEPLIHKVKLSPPGLPDLSELTCILSTPRFESSAHVILLFMDPSRPDPVVVAKAARVPGDCRSLRNEAESLSALHEMWPDAATSTPRVLSCTEVNGIWFLVETGVSGRTIRPAVVKHDFPGCREALLAWIDALTAATVRPPPRQDWVFRELVERPLETFRGAFGEVEDLGRLVDTTLAAVRPLSRWPLPVVFEHGDLGCPNLLLDAAGKLGVVDWESAEPNGLPGGDLFFSLAFLANSRIRLKDGATRMPQFRRAFFEGEAWAVPYVVRYARRVGFPAALLAPLFIAAWARYVTLPICRTLGEGRSPDPSQMDRRYLEMWRHSVAHAEELRAWEVRDAAP